MTMTYADAQDLFFVELVAFARMLLNPDAPEAAVDEVLTGLAGYGTQPGQVVANLIENTVIAHRGEFSARKLLARAVLELGMANMLSAIGSRYVEGGQLTDPVGAFFDLREQMDTDGDYIVGRGVSPASDPAPGSGILVERLTVDHLGHEIEGGVHSETVRGEIILNTLVGAGQGRAQLLLTGESGPEDELDYRDKGTGENANVTLDFVGDTNPGDVANSTFTVTRHRRNQREPCKLDAIGRNRNAGNDVHHHQPVAQPDRRHCHFGQRHREAVSADFDFGQRFRALPPGFRPVRGPPVRHLHGKHCHHHRQRNPHVQPRRLDTFGVQLPALPAERKPLSGQL
jgi:hypothetical protein